MYNLKVILATTREGRKGPAVAAWFMKWLEQQRDFDPELIDLKEVNLPFLDEPEHPKLRRYHHEHTKRWSARIDPADAFVFVICEYNYGFPATLKNALDFIYQEWNYKPVAFVSYGGIGAGARAVQMIKEVVTTQKMVPLFEAVHIPFFAKHINAEGEFIATDTMIKSAEVMMKELLKWTKGLKAMREAEK